METQLYFQMVKRGWWIILLTILAFLVATLVYIQVVTPRYEAQARFILNPSASVSLSGPNWVLDSLNTLDRESIIATYAEIMGSNRVYQGAIAALQLHPTEIEKYTFETNVVANSYIVELTVRGPDPDVAALIANSIGYQTIKFTEDLNQVIILDFLDMASPPDNPYMPQPLRDTVVAVVLGFVSGLILVVVSEQLLIPWEALRQQLQLDNLTGTFTKRHFTKLLEEEIAQNPDKNHTIGIVELSGLEDFIRTSPVMGAQKILRDSADVLRKELRGNDVIGRWNENEFILLLPGTQASAAYRIFERIFDSLTKPIKLDILDESLDLDVHIGGAEYSNNIASKELFEKVNEALENSRRDAKRSVYVWKFNSPFWAQPEDVQQ